jgi:hypothetical protein
MKNAIIGGLVVALVGVSGFLFFSSGEDVQVSNIDSAPDTSAITPEPVAVNEQLPEEDYFNEREAVDATKTYLKILQRMNYANFDNSGDADSISGLVMVMTAEALKDKSDLNNLITQSSKMRESKITVVKLTGTVVETVLMELVIAHDDYISFLRTVDPVNTDLAEFQYQMAQFQASTKSAYMNLAENTLIYPYVFVSFGGEEGVGNDWRISEASRAELLLEIDLLFGDIFIQDDLQYQETQTRDTTVFMVKSLRDFLESEV